MTWAIGDIHGCFRTLERILRRVDWTPSNDRLWLVGDLVNRGTRSLEVLRFAAENRERVTMVLGNHDLHLISRAHGVAAAKPTDRLDDVLEAPDREELVEWLAARPLLHSEGRFVLVHAGLLPTWSLDQAAALADAAGQMLAGSGRVELLAELARRGRPPWSADLEGLARLAVATTLLVKLRTVDAEGCPRLAFTGRPEVAPSGCRPWFEVSPVPTRTRTVLFGHWAALGFHRAAGAVCLDSACVYGGYLTAVCLENGRIVQERFAD